MLLAILVFTLWLPLAVAASRHQSAAVRRQHRFAARPRDRLYGGTETVL